MNAPIPPPIPTTPTKSTPFAPQAAMASWVTFLIFFVIWRSMKDAETRNDAVFVVFAFTWVIAGFTLGLSALFGIRTHGTKGILLPAVIGIILNGLMILILVTVLAVGYARARQRQRTEASPEVIVSGTTRPETALFWQPTGRTMSLAQWDPMTPFGKSGVMD